jgi:hypothetical protein
MGTTRRYEVDGLLSLSKEDRELVLDWCSSNLNEYSDDGDCVSGTISASYSYSMVDDMFESCKVSDWKDVGVSIWDLERDPDEQVRMSDVVKSSFVVQERERL